MMFKSKNGDSSNDDVRGSPSQMTTSTVVNSLNITPTPRLRRGASIERTTLLRFIPSSFVPTAKATTVGASPQIEHRSTNADKTRRENIFVKHQRHSNNKNNWSGDYVPNIIVSFLRTNIVIRDRWIGICTMLVMIIYVLSQHLMTIDLHMISFHTNGEDDNNPTFFDLMRSTRPQLQLHLDSLRGPTATEPQYRWRLCDPLSSSIDDEEGCYYHNASINASSTSLRQETFLLFNNSFHMTRYICQNISVAAYSQITIPSSTLACYDVEPSLRYSKNKKWNHHSKYLPRLSAASRLFEFPPLDLSNGPISPVKVRFGHRPPTQLFHDCDIPCYHDGEPISDRYVDVMDGSTWTISFSMEGPQYWQSIYVQPNGWREDRFWSTTSYRSEIPLPYYDNVTFRIWHNDYVSFDAGIKGGVFMAINCDSKNHREQIVQDLIQSDFRVDAISGCLHNADPPNGMNNELSDKVNIMKQYLFYLAFENQCEDDYITEKLWGAFEAGTIPIYYGASNVKDHVPNHSLIHVDDYNTTSELVQHLLSIVNDQKLYESYHLWRTQPMPEHFHTKYDFTATHSTCRTCRWAYARMYGIGWDHTSQSLRPLHIGFSRKVCFSSLIPLSSNNVQPINYLVQHPFVEKWIDVNGEDLHIASTVLSDNQFDNDAECRHPLTDANKSVDIDSGEWQRTLYNHDGVIDLIIRKGGSDLGNEGLALQKQVTLRLHFPLLIGPIRFRKISPNVWHVQSEKSRYTLLLATALSPKIEATVRQVSDITYDIAIEFSVRVRVIIEDVDAFHEGASDEVNYFGKLLAEDFFNPVQIFRRSLAD